MTWHCQLGHSFFKTVVVLAKSGAEGMEITDLPRKSPGLDARAASHAACVAAKAMRPLRNKSEALDTFKLFKATVENELQLKICKVGPRIMHGRNVGHL